MVRELCPCIFGAGFFDSYEEKMSGKDFWHKLSKRYDTFVSWNKKILEYGIFDFAGRGNNCLSAFDGDIACNGCY